LVSLIALGVVCASLAGGCDAQQASNPDSAKSAVLKAVGSTHDLCFSTDTTGPTITEGLDTIVNLGPDQVHVDRAQWLNDRGLKVLGISLFQRQDRDKFSTFGTWPGYPPKHLVRDGGPTLAEAWARRVPAEGATLPVTDDPDEHYFNVLISFTGVSVSGSAGPLRLSYTDADGHKGTVDTLVTVKTLPKCP